MFCPNCGKKMRKEVKEYLYAESGLDNIVLSSIPVFYCDKCSEVMPLIPHIEELHRVISHRIAISKAPLTGREARFLRKQMGLKAVDLARILGVSDVTVSRWENSKEHIGAASDRLIRILAIRKIEQDLAKRLEMHKLEHIFSGIVRSIAPPKIKISVNKILDYDFDLVSCAPVR